MLTILLAWLIADFFAGVIHWYEDKILDVPSTSFFGSIQADNELHHENPMAMTKYSAWQNINTTAPVTLPVSAALFMVGAPTLLWLPVFFGTFGNLVHKYAHLHHSQVPWIIRMVQKTGLFITFEQHRRHHYDKNGRVEKEDAKICYCPMTSWLNPALDKINFFGFLETLCGKKA